MLDINGLAVTYPNGALAVRDVDLRVQAGEIVALAGESGSGKSTIAKVLLGLLPPGSTVTGTAIVDGTELTGRAESAWQGIRAREIAMIPQGAMSGLNPVRRIGDQLVEALQLHTGLAGAQAGERAAELLSAVHLDRTTSRCYPHQLSGGMRQRIGIALALAGQPRLIVADEPTTGLDAVIQQRVLDLLAELRATTGVAMLVISHDLPALLSVADRLAIMYAGRIVELTDTRTARTSPAHPYTRGLVASTAAVDPTRTWHSIPGDASASTDAETGCPFRRRCPLAIDQCADHNPRLSPHGGTLVACHRAGDPQPLNLPSVPRPGAAPQERQPTLELTGVTLDFGDRHRRIRALADVSLQLHAGEIVGLIGESGSGKTTLARLALGVLQPTDGHVHVDGTDLRTLSRRQLRRLQQRLGFVPQDPYGSLHPAMTIADIVAEPLRIARRPRTQHLGRVREALAAAGLTPRPELLEAYPDRLSGGQRQRVAIARALANDPILLIADEATSMLDVSTRAGIAATLRRLAGERALAILFVTHDLGEATQVSDRITVLRHGKVVDAGPPKELVEKPEHPYTKQLLGSARAHTLDPDPTVS